MCAKEYIVGMGRVDFTGKVVVVGLVLCAVTAAGGYAGYRLTHTTTYAGKPAAKRQARSAPKPEVAPDPALQVQTKLAAAWRQALAALPPGSNVDVALYDKNTGAIVHSSAGTGPFLTASVVKLSILETLLWHDQQRGLPALTASQLEDARPMIEFSDNDSATDLYLQNGGSSGLNAFFKQVGATGSVASGPWGLTRTTAPDQVKVINEVAYPGGLLTDSSAGQADKLMDAVEKGQRWGVNGGVPAGVSVQLKNGWLADGDDDKGWIVNSVGHVHGEGVDYTIAVLTDKNNTLNNGIRTIESLSTAAWHTLVSLTASEP